MKALLCTLATLALALAWTAAAEDVVFGKDFTVVGEPLGEKFDPATATKKPILLFWGSAKCPRCAAEAKDFARYSRSAAKKGVQVIAVQSEDATATEVEDFIEDNRIQAAFYPNYKRLRYLTKNPELEAVFDGIPMFIIIEPGGKVTGWHKTMKDAKKALKPLEQK